MLKKILIIIEYLIYSFPFVGIIIPYLYITYVLNFTDIYPNDPSLLFGRDFLLQITKIVVYSWISIILGLILILNRLIIIKMEFQKIRGLYIYIIGVLLTIFLWKLDPGNYLCWFAD